MVAYPVRFQDVRRNIFHVLLKTVCSISYRPITEWASKSTLLLVCKMILPP